MTEHLQSLSLAITERAKIQIQAWIKDIVIPDPILTVAWVVDETPEAGACGHWAFLISANNPRKQEATITVEGIDIYMPISEEEAQMIQNKTIDSIDAQLTFV